MAFLPQVLNEFIRLHAEITNLKFIFLQPAEAVEALRSEEFDLAVIEHCPGLDFSGIDRYALPDDELYFVTALGNLPVMKDGCVNLDAIAHFRLFARRDGCSSKEVLRQVLRARGGDLSTFENVVISDDLRFTIQAIIAGQGIAFLSKALVTKQIEAGELVAFTLCGVPQRRSRSLLLNAGREHDPLLQDLLNCVFQVVSPGDHPQLILGSR
jgi:DNA-binding transcriptional LysR family regulator